MPPLARGPPRRCREHRQLILFVWAHSYNQNRCISSLLDTKPRTRTPSSHHRYRLYLSLSHGEALEILLQGHCGVHRERLRVHEICLKSGPNLGAVPSEVRLICNLEQTEPTWTVRFIGGAMRGAGAEQLSVLVRTVIESKASKNVLHLFYALGYKLDHELLRVGFAFHFQRGTQMTVTVSSVNKMLQLHATDEAVPVTPRIQMVEVTAPAQLTVGVKMHLSFTIVEMQSNTPKDVNPQVL